MRISLKCELTAATSCRLSGLSAQIGQNTLAGSNFTPRNQCIKTRGAFGKNEIGGFFRQFLSGETKK